jgi:DivIVA domain-containing protein
MAVTPDEVRNKQFTTSRFKEGYDLDEVDDFLDSIEETLSSLTKELQDLRATARGEIPASIRDEISSLSSDNSKLKNELAQSSRALENALAEVAQNASAGSDDSAANELREKLASVQSELQSDREELAQNVKAQSDLAQEISRLNMSVQELSDVNVQLATENEELKNSAPAAPPMDPADASSASVRILELAQRTADEAVATARIESEQIREIAELETRDLVASTRSEAEQLMSEAKAQIAAMNREFEINKVAMERRVEELRAYEREYRSRLRSYLEGQLRELETKNLGGQGQVEN